MLRSLAIIVATFIGGTTATAATVSYDLVFSGGPPGGAPYFEGAFQIDDARIVNGNCDSTSSKPCAALNDNESFTVTRTGGGLFSVADFWFQLLGEGRGGKKDFIGNVLYVTSNLLFSPLSLSVGDYGHNDGGQVINTSVLTAFQGITSLTFYTLGGGNVRIDDLALSYEIDDPSPIPVPAAGLLLLGALGGLAALRRRRNLV